MYNHFTQPTEVTDAVFAERRANARRGVEQVEAILRLPPHERYAAVHAMLMEGGAFRGLPDRAVDSFIRSFNLGIPDASPADASPAD
ncbi:MAG: hypothetical protein EOM24_37265, partial [Chloroflexia bacterium]|nr:hypothetical protein [Chloroflexia bacterium]